VDPWITLMLLKVDLSQPAGDSHDEAQLHELAGGVIDVDEERAFGTALLEPSVFGAVDLNKFSEAFTPIPGLMRYGLSRGPGQPEPRSEHPFSNRLAANADVMEFQELLVSQSRSKISVPSADQLDRLRLEGPRQPIVAWAYAF
jgi:hypothetical protein